jgi:hypothetical protein|tara:strand:+ start:1819 stop:2223 length:405 start_codon:yes stop_codon:yes gene_type:complete
MYELSTQELMVFVVLGFCCGVFATYYLGRILEIIHMWRLLRQVIAHLLFMCLTIVENVEFLNTLKLKSMHDADFTNEQIREFEEVWEHTLTNWKDSAILAIVSKGPPYFRTMMPFDDWKGAMKFLNSERKGGDE